ncbi:hypothetical protein [Streptomyces zaomyceticus]|uniref:hypothetical protein n=1 Tax=Streptomyces zaomyceticus TaxID=68286 RepID=UPI0033A99A2C
MGQGATETIADGRWTAVLDHTGATGAQVMTKAVLADANGNTVTQTITRAYDVRWFHDPARTAARRRPDVGRRGATTRSGRRRTKG